jgi:hypothetical protein
MLVLTGQNGPGTISAKSLIFLKLIFIIKILIYSKCNEYKAILFQVFDTAKIEHFMAKFSQVISKFVTRNFFLLLLRFE